MSNPRSGKLKGETINEEEEDDDDELKILV